MTRLAPWIAAATLIALGSASAAPAPTLHAHAALADPTVIGATTLTGYSPPVVVVPSGGSVAWRSTDGGHNQRETSTPLGSPSGCFSVPSTTSADSTPVQFDVSGNTVTATVGSTTATCLNAVSVGGAAFVVPYHCTIHPNMNGLIVVTA
jgi:plastocyanin